CQADPEIRFFRTCLEDQKSDENRHAPREKQRAWSHMAAHLWRTLQGAKIDGTWRGAMISDALPRHTVFGRDVARRASYIDRSRSAFETRSGKGGGIGVRGSATKMNLGRETEVNGLCWFPHGNRVSEGCQKQERRGSQVYER
ncbi:unnamed protein product, partial [Ectocarpus sp. 8 AP-2014]